MDATTRLSYWATVRAIFAGAPYKVVTDARPLSEVRSKWENPFYAGEHVGVVLSTCRNRRNRRDS